MIDFDCQGSMRARRRRAVGMWSTWSLRKVVHISISPLYRATPELHTFTEKDLHNPYSYYALLMILVSNLTYNRSRVVKVLGSELHLSNSSLRFLKQKSIVYITCHEPKDRTTDQHINKWIYN